MKKFSRICLGIYLIWGSTSSFSAQPAKAQHAMVATEQAIASQIGVNILRAGGNAVDAAVGIGYALAVVNPCCGNIGGGGFMTLHLANGKNVFVNFRETAPSKADKDMYLDKQGKIIPNKSVYGYQSVAVPGTVLGFETVLNKYGTMTRAQVISPAIELAKNGFTLTPGDVKLLAENNNTADFRKEKNVAAIFLKNNKPFQVGDQLIQKDLANSLKLIKEKGAEAFYEGKIAKEVVAASNLNNGILSLKDFQNYTVNELKPVQCTYRGYQVIAPPPPSSGGSTLCEILNILEKYPLSKLGYHSAESIHYITEAMRFSFANRNNQLGDPNFVNNPIEKIISKTYASQLRQLIKANKATPSSQVKAGVVEHEGMNTTHYSVIDKMGNAASVTYTLNSFFGSKLIAGNTGFFLNNEMDDFSSKAGEKNQFGLVEGDKNSIQPGKRPLSSMTPTIIMKDNKVVMIVGAPGGPRIITATLLTILNVLDYGMNIQDAVNAGRFHHQWLPDVIEVEKDALPEATLKKLTQMGYTIQSRNKWSAVEAIYVDPKSHIIYGANDIRRAAGKAIGY